VAKATPDGYTLVLAGNAPMVINWVGAAFICVHPRLSAAQ